MALKQVTDTQSVMLMFNIDV